MSDLINRLRETASKGVSVWGDLQMEAAQAIEALQAQIAKLDKLSATNIMLAVVPGEDGGGHEVYAKTVADVVDKLSDISGELEDWRLGIKRHHDFDKIEAERDAALAKLWELEAQEPVGAVLQSATNYDSTWSFICSSKQYLKTGIPIYTRPIPAQPTARTYMDGYGDGKQWALEEAAKICDSTPPHPFRPSIEAAWAIRKLGEGL